MDLVYVGIGYVRLVEGSSVVGTERGEGRRGGGGAVERGPWSGRRKLKLENEMLIQ